MTAVGSYSPGGVALGRSQHGIVEALVRAKGRCLSRGLLASRLESEIDDRSIIKYVERTRTAFRSIHPKFDQIEAIRGFGAYRWSVANRLTAWKPDPLPGLRRPAPPISTSPLAWVLWLWAYAEVERPG